MGAYATVNEYQTLYGPCKNDQEKEKVEMLIAIASDKLRQAAKNRGKDLDLMFESEEVLTNVAMEAVCRSVADFIGRAADLSTMGMTQMTQSALGYSLTGTYSVPGGGLTIMKRDLEALGINRARMGVVFLGYDPRSDS